MMAKGELFVRFLNFLVRGIFFDTEDFVGIHSRGGIPRWLLHYVSYRGCRISGKRSIVQKEKSK